MLSQKHTAVSIAVPSASPSEDGRSMSPAERIDLQSAINRAFDSGLQAHRIRLRNRLRKQSASRPFAEVCS